MRFQPKTDEQIAAEGLCPEGWFEAEVINAEEKTSQKGNDMIALKLKAFTPNGDRTVYDYLLEAFAYKLKHFCEAAGKADQYNDGTLTAQHCLGQVVEVEVVHETQKTGEYAGRTQAKVNDYRPVQRRSVARTATPAPTARPAQRAASGSTEFTKIEQDDIPF